MDVLKRREGLVVYRRGDEVIHEAATREASDELINCARFYAELQGTPFVPKLLGYDVQGDRTRLTVEYVADAPVKSWSRFIDNCSLLADILNERGIVHGDITKANVLVRDDVPVLIDFHQSRFTRENRPDKRPGTNREWLERLVVSM